MADNTSVGGIVATLRLEDSEWNRQIAEAEAKVRRLGLMHPDIKLDLDTGEALSKIAAVQAAIDGIDSHKTVTITTVEKTVGGGRSVVKPTPGNDFDTALEVAGATALTDAVEKLDAVTAALDAAQAADNEQMRQGSIQALKESINMEALAGAERKAARAALEKAAAESADAKATTSSSRAAGLKVTRMGLIVGAIAALIPLIAPLSGYAVGVAGALAGMGAAGVLAGIGIKNAIQAGTAEGQKFSDGLTTLKGVLNSLAGTSATAMLSSFEQAVKQIHAALPDLNSQIARFSRQLGVAGNSVLKGVIQAFKVMNPLFVQAGTYVEQLAAGFAKWTSDGGLQKFVSYAQQALPQVANTLGTLATALLHIVEATAPIGSVTLGILTGLSDAINAIPTPLLTALIVAASGVVIGFKAWQVIPKIIGTVRTAMTAMGGALPIASVILLTTALANLAGAGIGNIVSDMTGLSDAYKEVDKAVASGDLGSAKAKQSVAQLEASLKYARGQLGGFAGTMIDVSNQLEKSGWGWLGGPVQGFIQSTFGKTTEKVNAYKTATDAAKQAQDSAAGSAAALAAKVSALQTAFDGLNGTNLNVAQAQTAQAAAFNAVTASIQQNGAAIDGNSAAAVANQQAIQAAALAAQQNATAVATQTGSTNAGTQAFMSSKTALEQQLAAQGLLTPAVQAYVDTLFKVPTSVATKLSADNAAANAAIANTKAQLDALNGTTVTVYIEGQQVGDFGHINVPGRAGGPDQKFAGGGTVRGPGSNTSDSVVIRASASEEVVANDKGQAPKFRAALKAINAGDSVSTVQSILAGMSSRSAGTVATTPTPVVNVQAGSSSGTSNVYKFYITEATDADATAQRVLHYIQNTGA